MSHEQYPTQPDHEAIERVFGDIAEIGQLFATEDNLIPSKVSTRIDTYGARFVVDEDTGEQALVQLYDQLDSRTRCIVLTRQNTPREVEVTGSFVWLGNHWRPDMSRAQTASLDLHDGRFKYLSVQGRDGRWTRTRQESAADPEEQKEIVDFVHRALLRAVELTKRKGSLS